MSQTNNRLGFRPLVYIIAPFVTATTSERGERWQAMKKALSLGWAPVWAPGIYSSVLVDSQDNERDTALDCAISLLRKSDAVMILGERLTDGMKKELEWLAEDDCLADELCTLSKASVGYRKPRYNMETLPAATGGCNELH